MIKQQWTLLSEGGGQLVQFSSLLDIDILNEGQALSYPVEEGAFMTYNKVQSPLDIRVTLAKMGLPFEFADILKTLDKYQAEALKLSAVTPSAYFDSLTLQSYSHRHESRQNANMLTVELHLVEVREVESQTSNVEVSSPKNPTSAGKVNTGKKQAQTGTSTGTAPDQKRQSFAKKIGL